MQPRHLICPGCVWLLPGLRVCPVPLAGVASVEASGQL